MKGQVFTLDYIIGFVMFIILIVIAGYQLVNILPSTSYDVLYEENIYLSNALLQPGYPTDWSPANVLFPGIAYNGRLDKTKLNYLDSFSYDIGKSYFHITSDYLFYFQDKDGILNMSHCIYGYNVAVNSTCHPDLSTIGYANLVKTNRLVIYNSTIIEMVLYSWN